MKFYVIRRTETEEYLSMLGSRPITLDDFSSLNIAQIFTVDTVITADLLIPKYIGTEICRLDVTQVFCSPAPDYNALSDDSAEKSTVKQATGGKVPGISVDDSIRTPIFSPEYYKDLQAGNMKVEPNVEDCTAGSL